MDTKQELRYYMVDAEVLVEGEKQSGVTIIGVHHLDTKTLQEALKELLQESNFILSLTDSGDSEDLELIRKLSDLESNNCNYVKVYALSSVDLSIISVVWVYDPYYEQTLVASK